jgi:hypothetical protein
MTPADVLTPAIINPDAVYHDGQARLLLGLTGATLARARREHRLRYTRQGHSILYRGSWLLSWLEADASAVAQSSASALGKEGRGRV